MALDALVQPIAQRVEASAHCYRQTFYKGGRVHTQTKQLLQRIHGIGVAALVALKCGSIVLNCPLGPRLDSGMSLALLLNPRKQVYRLAQGAQAVVHI